MEDKENLDAQILKAHYDENHEDLVSLYKIAGQHARQSHDDDAARFFFTYAYIFALETGHEHTQMLHDFLVDLGSE